ncbi:MAG: response regulator [Candidatus Omnitrophica bacterium]|nr:response regulator [Candidatus Omnitrophota bacterium]
MNHEQQKLPHEIEISLRGIQGNCERLIGLARSRSEDSYLDDLLKIQKEVGVFRKILREAIPQLDAAHDPDTLRRVRHDLTNPLNPIIGYSEMLLEESEDLEDNPYASDLIKIRTTGRALLRWVSEGLSTSSLSMVRNNGAEPEVSQDQEVRPYEGSESEEIECSCVLIVEDNPDNQELLARLLARFGCKATPVDTGEAALEALEDGQFDLVLLDIGLPGISGFEVLTSLRKRFTPAELPVIMATALDNTEDVVRAFDLGANDYVTKPLDKAVVLARSKTQIALKKSQEKIRNLVEGLELRNMLIRETFGRYVPDEVVEELLSQPEALALEGQRKKVSILMSDLRGFTSMSERIPPEQIVKILNIYLGTMVGVIDEFKGTIDEFIGDAILVIFGAPHSRDDDTERAVACALAMQEAMTSVNRQLKDKNLPTVEMGIGINTGEVVVGNIGSLERAKYGVIGMPVNLASRIESYSVGGQVLISENTYREISSLLQVRKETAVRVKGFGDPITFFEVTGMTGRYRYSLKRERDELYPMPEPQPVRFSAIDGKAMESEEREGFFASASLKEAILITASELEPYTNLELNLIDADGSSIPGDLYAKVVSVPQVEGEGCRLRFTDVPETVETSLKGLILNLKNKEKRGEG